MFYLLSDKQFTILAVCSSSLSINLFIKFFSHCFDLLIVEWCQRESLWQLIQVFYIFLIRSFLVVVVHILHNVGKKSKIQSNRDRDQQKDRQTVISLQRQNIVTVYCSSSKLPLYDTVF